MEVKHMIVYFKYIINIIVFSSSGNPAANCGIRIFALKKMMDFLSKEIKDHEHVFVGNIIEKGKLVKCLIERNKNLTESICPQGTIKHLATASAAPTGGGHEGMSAVEACTSAVCLLSMPSSWR